MRSFSGTIARFRAWLWNTISRRTKDEEGSHLLALAVGGFLVCFFLFLLNPASLPVAVKSSFVLGAAVCALLAGKLWSVRSLDRCKMAQAERILVALAGCFSAESDPLGAQADLRGDQYQANNPDWLTLTVKSEKAGRVLRLAAGREVKLKGGEAGGLQADIKDRLILTLSLTDRARLESFRQSLDQNSHPDMRTNTVQGGNLVTTLQESKTRAMQTEKRLHADVSNTSLTRWMDWYTSKLSKLP